MKRQPEAESRLVKVAVILFTVISLATVVCEKAKGLCEKTEEFVYALQHLATAISHPDQHKTIQHPVPNKRVEPGADGIDKAEQAGDTTKGE